MAASEMRALLLGLLALAPAVALAQSAGEVERCFQNPSSCSWSGGVPTPLPHAAPAPAPVASTAPAPAARAPDYTTVLNSPDPDRRKLQESLRTLDKYNGPIDGNLQSESTMKGISDWQKGHGYNPSGKLTPTEAVTLNNEPAGDVSDASMLTGKLEEIFKARETNGVFREGTNEVEKTIFIKSPTSVRYGDVVKVIDAIKGAGASPVGLQVDDLPQ